MRSGARPAGCGAALSHLPRSGGLQEGSVVSQQHDGMRKRPASTGAWPGRWEREGSSMSRAGSEEVVQAGLEMMAAKGELLQKIARINGPGLHECVICCALLYGNDSVAYHAEWHKRLDGEVE